jgi:hypothetical protein
MERSIVTLSIGKLHIHETVKQCKLCKKIYAPDQPGQMTPQYCNFGFDVIVYCGRAVFQGHQTEDEIAAELQEKNVHISEREVSYLAKKFVCYLALAHREKVPEIRKLIEDNGGSCLHFDGTNDGGSPHLLVAVDEQEKLVLETVKATSESTESVSRLLEQVKCDYGDPLALVHDLGKANLSAVQSVFPRVANYVCHFHFLRDLGKDLFGYEEACVRSILQGCAIKGRLKALAKKLREFVNTDQVRLLLLKKTTSLAPDGVDSLAKTDIAYLLIEWILDFSDELSGYGFPFDREKLVFVQRMRKVEKFIQALPSRHGYLKTLQEELAEVLGNTALMQFIASMEKKTAHFDQLRNIMRIAEPGGADGLNDDAMDCDMDAIKTRVENFINSEEIKQELLRDPDYRKMVGQIKKYWDKLFTKPITLTSKNGQTRTIQPQRTNNLMERFFRELNRGSRKRTGGKTLGRVLVTMLAETPLVKNLENEKYERILLNGCATLAERFAEIEAQQVREKIREAAQEAEKLHPAIKSIIRNPKLPDYLIETCNSTHQPLDQAACC